MKYLIGTRFIYPDGSYHRVVKYSGGVYILEDDNGRLIGDWNLFEIKDIILIDAKVLHPWSEYYKSIRKK